VDAYARLGLTSSATPSQVRRAYRQAVQRWHPDRHPGDPLAQERFIAIQVAYRRLTQPDHHHPDRPVHSPAPPSPRVPGDHARIQILLPLASVFAPQTGSVTVRIGEPCPACSGTQSACPHCQGRGQVFRPRTFALHVPAGAHPGQILRLAGQGHHGALFTHPGDLWVEVVWTRRGRWRWEQGRLTRAIWLSRRVRTRGGAVRLTTPDGRRGWITVPAVPRHSWLRVPGLGLPRDEGSRAAAWLWIR